MTPSTLPCSPPSAPSSPPSRFVAHVLYHHPRLSPKLGFRPPRRRRGSGGSDRARHRCRRLARAGTARGRPWRTPFQPYSDAIKQQQQLNAGRRERRSPASPACIFFLRTTPSLKLEVSLPLHASLVILDFLGLVSICCCSALL